MKQEDIRALNKRFEKLSSREVLEFFLKEYEGRIALSSSLGAEDQALTHMVSGIPPVPMIFTLDTGRMFPEQYDLIQKTRDVLDVNVEVFFPEASQVESMVGDKGINLFYESVENRKLCCRIRKIEPLQRALKGVDVWITGVRADQSVTRINTRLLEWDDTYDLLKLNPLIFWTGDQVWAYIREHGVPYNPLHDQGYPSIGCQPCTGLVKPGEDPRSGRWWWEQPESRECGLHDRPKK